MKSALGYVAITRKNAPIDDTFGKHIEEIMKWVC